MAPTHEWEHNACEHRELGKVLFKVAGSHPPHLPSKTMQGQELDRTPHSNASLTASGMVKPLQ